jgi:uncharacterized membrane protein YfcA
MTFPIVGAAALGAAAGGFIQGLSGFAFGLVAVGVWAWTIDPRVAGPLVVFGSMVSQLLALGPLCRGLELRRLLPFIIGGVLGVPIGVALLRHIDPVGFKLAVGIILLTWCPLMLAVRDLPRIAAGGRWADAGAGWVGGVMGGLGGLNGPAPVLWCVLRGWERDVQRGVVQPYILVLQGVTMAAYVATGTIRGDTVWLFAVVAAALAIPTLIGVRLYNRFDGHGFRRIVLLLLTVSGAALVGSGLVQLL